MTKEEALNFLKSNQPLPSDEEIQEETLEIYEQVYKFFRDNLYEECIPLLLNSFGGWDGYGVYDMVEGTILEYDKEKVIPHLLAGLKSENIFVQYRCAQISGSFPDEELITILEDLVYNSCEEGIRVMAAISLDVMYEELRGEEGHFCEMFDELNDDL